MMTKRFLNVAVFCTAVLAVGWARDAMAHHSYFTFSHAVEIPGNVVLPPGRYEFRIIQTATARRLIEVRDASTQKVYATLLAVPAEHSGPGGTFQIRLAKVREDQTPAALFLWDGGGRPGYEFVYPREQALKLSRAMQTSIAMSPLPLSSPVALRSARVTRTETINEPVGTTGATPADVIGEGGPH